MAIAFRTRRVILEQPVRQRMNFHELHDREDLLSVLRVHLVQRAVTGRDVRLSMIKPGYSFAHGRPLVDVEVLLFLHELEDALRDDVWIHESFGWIFGRRWPCKVESASTIEVSSKKSHAIIDVNRISRNPLFAIDER